MIVTGTINPYQDKLPFISAFGLPLVKRFFDFLVAFILLFCLWPVMLFVALLIRVRMGSPVVFRQERPGLNGQPFFLLKFRTMNTVYGADGQVSPDSERLTILGTWIRRLSLDELPQLVNILRGEMSLVGPRPLLMEYLPLYSSAQARRHDVLPGITGWAQINGRNAVSWDERFRLDLWYVENRSFGLDIYILYKTVFKVFERKGISQAGHATMPKFTGNGTDV